MKGIVVYTPEIMITNTKNVKMQYTSNYNSRKEVN